MPDILTDTEIAEITDLVDNVGVILLQGDTTMLLRSCNALLASHAALMAEVARMRTALQMVASIAGNEIAEEPENFRLLVAMQQIARAALTKRATDATP